VYVAFALVQEKLLSRRHESQKAAAYNLAAGEAATARNKAKNQDYFVSVLSKIRN
jgi:hypothetical protein